MVTKEGLLRKYDVPIPRYTSYPAVPHWNSNTFSPSLWVDEVKEAFNASNSSKGISLYLHLPYCESLCTYCACNTHITKNHAVEEFYIKALVNEWNFYLSLFDSPPIIRELHLGGGTPTFFTAHNLQSLLSNLFTQSLLHPLHEFSFEGHPNNTTREHLETLFDLGFRRVSYGVQDLDEKVQKAIHRVQPFENLERVTQQSREVGFESVGYDLVYGLPFQTADSLSMTMHKTISLLPDRISFYGYAHVPWVKPGQRGYEDCDLPNAEQRSLLNELGRGLLVQAGYVEIGMDHFALPGDCLALALENGQLHRNFMGYTTTNTNLLIGLGSSAISDTGYSFAQNRKIVREYIGALQQPANPVVKGHLLSETDRLVRQIIQQISCQGKFDMKIVDQLSNIDQITGTLKDMQHDGLIAYDGSYRIVTDLGRQFIRNICSVFDQYLLQAPGTTPTFSQAV